MLGICTIITIQSREDLEEIEDIYFLQLPTFKISVDGSVCHKYALWKTNLNINQSMGNECSIL